MEEFLATHSISCEAFPCHQTDSRLVGKFVPVESGTVPSLSQSFYGIVRAAGNDDPPQDCTGFVAGGS